MKYRKFTSGTVKGTGEDDLFGGPQSSPDDYVTYLNLQFPHLSKIAVPALVDAVTDRWFNQTLCQVKGSVARMSSIQSEYHWHQHDHDDEFLFSLEGEFLIHFQDRTFTLQPRQGMVVPKGVVHRTRAIDSVNSRGRISRHHSRQRLMILRTST